jgi:hypothetical protein
MLVTFSLILTKLFGVFDRLGIGLYSIYVSEVFGPKPSPVDYFWYYPEVFLLVFVLLG